MMARVLTTSRLAGAALPRIGAPVVNKRHLVTATAKELLDQHHSKGDERLSVSPDDSLMAAANTLLENRMGAITVKTESSVVGILSERDYMKATVKGADPSTTKVKDVMTGAKEMISVEGDANLGKIMSIMNEKHIRHIPAFSKGQFIGLLTIRDVVKKVAEESAKEVEQMQEYVAGTY